MNIHRNERTTNEVNVKVIQIKSESNIDKIF